MHLLLYRKSSMWFLVVVFEVNGKEKERGHGEGKRRKGVTARERERERKEVTGKRKGSKRVWVK